MSVRAPVRTRCLDRRSRFRYVRLITSGGRRCWQARAWLPLPVGSINLGCYRDERAAWEAVRLWLRAGADPVRDLPPGVLPKWVRRHGDGRFDAVLRSAAGERIVLAGGPWATAQDAHRAALAVVADKVEEQRVAVSRERVGRWGRSDAKPGRTTANAVPAAPAPAGR